MNNIEISSNQLEIPWYSSSVNHIAMWHATSGHFIPTTHCKEILAWRFFQNNSKHIIMRFGRDISAKTLNKCEAKINKLGLKWGAKTPVELLHIKIDKKIREDYISVSVPPTWGKNSVSFFILISLVRYFIAKEIDIKTSDKTHLGKASKLLSLIDKEGLKVLGTKKHATYDYGIVALQTELEKLYDAKSFGAPTQHLFKKADERAKKDRNKRTRRYATLRRHYVEMRPAKGKRIDALLK